MNLNVGTHERDFIREGKVKGFSLTKSVAITQQICISLIKVTTQGRKHAAVKPQKSIKGRDQNYSHKIWILYYVINYTILLLYNTSTNKS